MSVGELETFTSYFTVFIGFCMYTYRGKSKQLNDKSINGVIMKQEVARHDIAIMCMHVDQCVYRKARMIITYKTPKDSTSKEASNEY